MKVIVSGGGTGGHIYPAVSIIEELKSRDKNLELLYIGRENSLESEIIPKLGIDFKGIRVKGLPRKINKNFFIAIKELFIGLKQSKNIIKEFNPDFVIGTGGFVTGPVLYKAFRLKYKIYFHEQNSYPGVTNRILSRYANKYFVTFKESIDFFKNKDRAIITGNPIRNKFKNLNSIKDNVYNEYEFDNNLKTIFSFGGSNGSRILNENILEMINNNKNQNYQLIHITGKNYYDDFIEKLNNKNNPRIKIFPYLDDIQKAYSISDLIITSSGAITLAELSFLGLPSILIPKPYTTENHQEYNAKVYEKNGASKMMLEKEMNSKNLNENILEIINNDEILKLMGENAKKMATPQAAEEIVCKILEDINE